MFQMAIKYINIFQSEALQNLPKLGFLVWKKTIWQSSWKWVVRVSTVAWECRVPPRLIIKTLKIGYSFHLKGIGPRILNLKWVVSGVQTMWNQSHYPV
jgi:hypothetical protein